MGTDYILILGKPNFTASSTRNSYYVSLVINDLTQLWSGFADIMGTFDFEKRAVQIMVYDGTLANLFDDLQAAPAYYALQGVVIPDASTTLAPLLGDMETQQLGRGAILSCTVQINSSSLKPMSSSFSIASDPASRGTISV